MERICHIRVKIEAQAGLGTFSTGCVIEANNTVSQGQGGKEQRTETEMRSLMSSELGSTTKTVWITHSTSTGAIQ